LIDRKPKQMFWNELQNEATKGATDYAMNSGQQNHDASPTNQSDIATCFSGVCICRQTMHPIKRHAITGQRIFYSDSPGEKETLAEFSKHTRYQIALRVDLAYCDSKLNPRRSLLK
jgi:hypothetical protein